EKRRYDRQLSVVNRLLSDSDVLDSIGSVKEVYSRIIIRLNSISESTAADLLRMRSRDREGIDEQFVKNELAEAGLAVWKIYRVKDEKIVSEWWVGDSAENVKQEISVGKGKIICLKDGGIIVQRGWEAIAIQPQEGYELIGWQDLEEARECLREALEEEVYEREGAMKLLAAYDEELKFILFVLVKNNHIHEVMVSGWLKAGYVTWLKETYAQADVGLRAALTGEIKCHLEGAGENQFYVYRPGCGINTGKWEDHVPANIKLRTPAGAVCYDGKAGELCLVSGFDMLIINRKECYNIVQWEELDDVCRRISWCLGYCPTASVASLLGCEDIAGFMFFVLLKEDEIAGWQGIREILERRYQMVYENSNGIKTISCRLQQVNAELDRIKGQFEYIEYQDLDELERLQQEVCVSQDDKQLVEFVNSLIEDIKSFNNESAILKQRYTDVRELLSGFSKITASSWEDTYSMVVDLERNVKQIIEERGELEARAAAMLSRLSGLENKIEAKRKESFTELDSNIGEIEDTFQAARIELTAGGQVPVIEEVIDVSRRMLNELAAGVDLKMADKYRLIVAAGYVINSLSKAMRELKERQAWARFFVYSREYPNGVFIRVPDGYFQKIVKFTNGEIACHDAREFWVMKSGHAVVIKAEVFPKLVLGLEISAAHQRLLEVLMGTASVKSLAQYDSAIEFIFLKLSDNMDLSKIVEPPFVWDRYLTYLENVYAAICGQIVDEIKAEENPLDAFNIKSAVEQELVSNFAEGTKKRFFVYSEEQPRGEWIDISGNYFTHEIKFGECALVYCLRTGDLWIIRGQEAVVISKNIKINILPSWERIAEAQKWLCSVLLDDKYIMGRLMSYYHELKFLFFFNLIDTQDISRAQQGDLSRKKYQVWVMDLYAIICRRIADKLNKEKDISGLLKIKAVLTSEITRGFSEGIGGSRLFVFSENIPYRWVKLPDNYFQRSAKFADCEFFFHDGNEIWAVVGFEAVVLYRKENYRVVGWCEIEQAYRQFRVVSENVRRGGSPFLLLPYQEVIEFIVFILLKNNPAAEEINLGIVKACYKNWIEKSYGYVRGIISSGVKIAGIEKIVKLKGDLEEAMQDELFVNEEHRVPEKESLPAVKDERSLVKTFNDLWIIFRMDYIRSFQRNDKSLSTLASELGMFQPNLSKIIKEGKDLPRFFDITCRSWWNFLGVAENSQMSISEVKLQFIAAYLNRYFSVEGAGEVNLEDINFEWIMRVTEDKNSLGLLRYPVFKFYVLAGIILQYRKVYNVSPKPPPDPAKSGSKRLGLRKSPITGDNKLSPKAIFLKEKNENMTQILQGLGITEKLLDAVLLHLNFLSQPVDLPFCFKPSCNLSWTEIERKFFQIIAVQRVTPKQLEREFGCYNKTYKKFENAGGKFARLRQRHKEPLLCFFGFSYQICAPPLWLIFAASFLLVSIYLVCRVSRGNTNSIFSLIQKTALSLGAVSAVFLSFPSVSFALPSIFQTIRGGFALRVFSGILVFFLFVLAMDLAAALPVKHSERDAMIIAKIDTHLG
ncbi:MAG: hypothetical protein V2A64_05015, partial [Candidatus Omnitrophota bacterium]